MSSYSNISYFLGGNTPGGFNSLFSRSFNTHSGWRVFIIKGGPGTGKSTLMRKVSERCEQLSLSYEQIFCSSAPESLDAVIVPSAKLAIYDGTSPHVLEPQLPGACENIVDIGSAWDKAALYARREKIAELASECSEHHRSAQKMLTAADAFRMNTYALAASSIDAEKAERIADRIIERYFSGSSASSSYQGATEWRQLTAVTPNGVIPADSELSQKLETIIPVIDRWYAPSALLLGLLRTRLISRGIDNIACICSQSTDRIEHIIVPSHSTMINTVSDIHTIEGNKRAIRCERFINADLVEGARKHLSVNKRGIKEFTALAAEQMQTAKSVHDRLEEQYIAAMDFDKVEAITQRVLSDMFG